MGIRAVVVYQHPLVRDVTVNLLWRAGVNVVGAVPWLDLSLDLLQDLQPEVVIVEQGDSDRPCSLADPALLMLSPPTASISRVIAIRSADSSMVICGKELVKEATAESLIAATLGERG